MPAVGIAELSRRRAGLIIRSAAPPSLDERPAALLVGTVVLADLLGVVLLFS